MNKHPNFNIRRRGLRAQLAVVIGSSLIVLIIGCGGSGGGTKATTTTGTTSTATGTATGTTSTATSTSTATATGTATGTATASGTATATGGTGSTAGGIAVHYHVTSLGTFGNDLPMYPNAINNSEQVVGESHSGTNSAIYATMWNPTTKTITDLSGGNWTTATKINNNGVILGEKYDNALGSPTGGVYWQNGSTTMTVPTIGSLTNITLSGVNNNNEIVGTSSQGAFFVALGNLANPVMLQSYSGGSSAALAINDNHQIVGASEVQQGHSGPMFWSSSSAVPTDLGDVAFSSNSANFINNSGQIAGVDGETMVYWAASGSAEQDLGFGTLGGMNSSGTVVGTQSISSSNVAIAWTPKSGVVNLNTLLDSASSGWILSSASAINDSGWIVGYGTLNGTLQGFIAQPLTQ